MAQTKTYYIEHMEADEPELSASALPPWVQLEYVHIAEHARAVFSSLSTASATALQKALPPTTASRATTEGIEALLRGHDRARVCLLDPRAAEELSPSDAERFDACLFGGILGDHPPRDRTGELRRLGLPSRRLGPVQMTTDTAVLVTQLVLEGGRSLEALAYVDEPEIQLGNGESVEMPFRYLADAEGRPRLPQGMVAHLASDLDRAFDV